MRENSSFEVAVDFVRLREDGGNFLFWTNHGAERK